ncbi:MAG: alpha-N-arabinofuranosidase [Terriglobales bacterium]
MHNRLRGSPSTMPFNRRTFLAGGAAAGGLVLLPRLGRALAPATASTRVRIYPDRAIGVVKPEFHGQFAEHLGTCIYGGLWVGRGSRIPNVDGYRAAAIQYLAELGIPVLRWPGGCYADDYHWRSGVGAERPRTVNIWWGGGVDENSFGTHEFIGLCRKIGAQPYLAGNVGSGSPEELRDWMEYCNYPSGAHGSTLADERARNGSPEPFDVRYWGIGNESWGCGGDMRPEEYATLYRRFANYLHPFGGVRPTLIASGPNGNDARWTRGLMDGLGRTRPGGISMHFYEGGDAPPTQFTLDQVKKQLAIFPRVEEGIQQQRAILDGYYAGKRVGLVLDEWGVWDRPPQAVEKRYGLLWQQDTQRGAAAAGLGLNMFNRQADKLMMCNIAQMVNVLQSLLLTDGPDGDRCIRTPTYYVFQMFKPHRGQTAVQVEASDSGPLGLSASASRNGQDFLLTLVNPSPDTALEVDCDFGGAAVAARARILHDPDWNACNTFDQPNRLVPRPHPVATTAGRLRLSVPGLAVIAVEARLS